tara:strand:+ start:662 stop:1333 length:672 start_codon:yes stop_codon:yes gene_type:complete
MRNLLARGGIEFLAVLLGITTSLYIDNNNKVKELDKQTKEVYSLLKKQIEDLSEYSDDRLNLYNSQVNLMEDLVSSWDSFKPSSIDNKDNYVEDIWFSIKNSFNPDLSTYKTLINSGKINVVDFETIKLFGKLYGFVQEIYDIQKKELVARDFVEQRLLLEHSQYFKKYSMPYDLLELLDVTRNDEVIYASLKFILSLKKSRNVRILSLKQKMKSLENHLKIK